MRRAIIAVLVLVGGYAQAVVLSIGLHQYVITDAGKQVFEKAEETCAKARKEDDAAGSNGGRS
jgi:hypothetical protein